MVNQDKLAEIMKLRHAVRHYSDAPMEKHKIDELNKIIDLCNNEGGLHMQLVTDEPKGFKGMRSRYGEFENVKNYIAMIGKDSPDLEKRIGYYGEMVVLKAVELGLGTCWAAMTYTIRNCGIKVSSDEKFLCSVAVGHYINAGVPHESKPMNKMYTAKGNIPDWFKKGMEAVMIAPTAMNQQKFHFYLDGNKVTVKTGRSSFSKVDLGIIKRHFELGAGYDDWEWVER